MKTFFTKLGSLLLCGVAFAMVGCTDFSEDIQAVDKKVDQVASNLSATDVKVENLQQTLNELSARLDADYATKAELKKVNDDLNKVIADQVAGLDAKIGKVGEDLAAAVKGVNAAIAELEAADAANEAAIEAARAEAQAAVATLAAALEAEKAAIEAEIEAINAQIAETNEAIAAVDAKAEENHNTLVALSDYLKNLEAKVLELKNELVALSAYLPTVEAKIASNTAKIDELKNTLESLAFHLNAKEAEVDAKLNELHNTLASLSVYMDVLEASIDARFAEILNTFESLSIHLAKLEAQVALNTESSAAANAKAEELFNTILSLSEYLAEEKAANDAKFQEILNTFESLSIHLAKLEAEHAAGIADNSAKIAELKNELVALSAHLEEREAGVDAKLNELQNTFLALSEHLNAEEAANAAKFAEILATFDALSYHLDVEEAENDAKFAELQNTLLSLSEYLPTVEAKVDELKNELVALSAHLEEREPLVDAKLSELQNTLLSLSIYLEEADLVNRVSALEGDLKAHKAAFEVFEAATVDQLANLFARTDEIFGQLEALSPEFAAVKSQVAELKNELVALSAHLEEREAGVDAKLNELFATFQALSPVIETMQAQILENNATLVALSPVIETMKAQILENFNTLQSLSPEIEKLHAKDAELEAKVAELKNELSALSEYLPTVEAKVAELKAELVALSAHLGEREPLVDAKLAELHSQLLSISEQLPEQLNAIDAKANELKGQLDALAEQLPGMLQAIRDEFTSLTDQLIDEINGLIQSLVFVPETADGNAEANVYEFFTEKYNAAREPINNQIVVRATYQVTPQSLVTRIGNELEVLAALQPVKYLQTRAAADAYVWAEKVIVTDVNEATGKFDVDIIFDAEKYLNGMERKGGFALALYVQHPANVEPAIDEEMAVPSIETIIKTCISSEFVNLNTNVYDLPELYVLARPVVDDVDNMAAGQYAQYQATADVVEWSDADNARNPYEGYEVMLYIDGEYLTLAEAAELIRVDVETITPAYFQYETYGIATDIMDFDAKDKTHFVLEEECEGVHAIAENQVAWDKTYSIDGTVTEKTAKNYVGHQLNTFGAFYFGTLDQAKFKANAPLNNVVIRNDYSYTIDYRTTILTLTGTEGAHELPWNLANARKLSTQTETGWNAYVKPINKAFAEKYGEYEMVVEGNANIDYKKVMEAALANDSAYPKSVVKNITVNGGKTVEEGADTPKLTIVPSTHLIHPIASIEVVDYAFAKNPTKYQFNQIYRDYETYTKVEYHYDLTLGARPDVVEVAFDHTLAYTNRGYKTTFNVDSLVSTNSTPNFNQYLAEAEVGKYNPDSDKSASLNSHLFANTKTTPVEVAKAMTLFRSKTGSMELSAENIEDIREMGGFITKSVPTWYGVEFKFNIDLTVTEPAYGLETIAAYVNEDNEAHIQYEFIKGNDGSYYSIKNADLAHYFKVVGKDKANDLKVRLSIVLPEGVASADAPKILYNGGEYDKVDLFNDIKDDGSIIPASFIVDWKNYNRLSIDVKAELFVNGDTEAFDTEVVTIIAEDPIQKIEANAKNAQVTRKAESDYTSFDVLKAVDVYLLADPKAPFAADLFVANASKYDYRKQSAYGATFNINADKARVYYYDNGIQKVYSPELYEFDGTTITLYPETTILQTEIFAEFDVEVYYDLNGDVDYKTTTTKKTTVKVTFNVPAK